MNKMNPFDKIDEITSILFKMLEVAVFMFISLVSTEQVNIFMNTVYEITF